MNNGESVSLTPLVDFLFIIVFALLLSLQDVSAENTQNYEAVIEDLQTQLESTQFPSRTSGGI